jgi:potassium-dependent mechanosensitive channel
MNDPRVQALLDQLDTTLLLLERPVVQNQLIAFMAIFLLSWLLPEPLGGLLNKLIAQQDAITHRRQRLGLPVNVWRTRLLRWLRGAQLLLFPIVGLISSQLTIGYFAAQGWPLGLLQRLATVFWLVLIYQFVGSILFGSLPPERARAYHRRLVTPAFVILVAISLSAGLAGAFPIVRMELFRIMGTPLTVATVFTAALVLYATVTIGWATNEVLRNLVLPHAQADTGLSNTVLIITRYAIIAIGALLAISILGVDLSAFAIIGGGLSVGIGFGLQDLVANFISGILLLFEQTLRPGDIIEVSGQRGRVNQMRMRSAVLRTADNVDIYVPNKTLLTSTVATYTHMKPATRKTLNVGVSYDSDPIEVRDTLQHVVENHGLVLKDPAPAVFFIGFGSFTLDFEIAVTIADPGRAAQVLSDLHFMIYREFTKRGIEIPIPQQDFHLRTSTPAPIEQLLSAQPAEPTQQTGSHLEIPQPASKSGQKFEKGTGDEPAKAAQAPASGAVKTDTGKSLSPDRVKAPAEKPKLPG